MASVIGLATQNNGVQAFGAIHGCNKYSYKGASM